MSRILIADAGPLFSLAAGNLLGLLTHFRLGLTDVVREESVDRGLLPDASVEAQRLLAFYNAHAAHIETFATQVGITVRAKRLADPLYQMPRHVGELSIQSLLIDLQLQGSSEPPVVVFEDAWFMRNASALAKPCVLLSTQALLNYAESKGWIASAELARQAITQARPLAYPASITIGPA